MPETSTALAQRDGAEILERVVALGDLANLTPAERVAYYRAVCESLGLNPLTKPFDYLRLSGKLVLYANRTASDQLANLNKLSLTMVRSEQLGDTYVVTARASGQDGRTVENVGAVPIANLPPDALANAIMKAVTKAYRRATLAYSGLGWMDETEISTVHGAAPIAVDHETGEIAKQPPRLTPEEIRAELVAAWTRGIEAAAAAGLTPAEDDHDVSDLDNKAIRALIDALAEQLRQHRASPAKPDQAEARSKLGLPV